MSRRLQELHKLRVSYRYQTHETTGGARSNEIGVDVFVSYVESPHSRSTDHFGTKNWANTEKNVPLLLIFCFTFKVGSAFYPSMQDNVHAYCIATSQYVFLL